VLLIIEVSIAILFSEGFIRSTFGDFLVVILIYCFIKSFTNIKPLPAVAGVLIFAFTVEFLQLLNLVDILNIHDNTIARIVLGTTFQVTDLFAYFFGTMAILIIEYKIKTGKQQF